MSEIDSAVCPCAMVESYPQKAILDGKPMLTVYVRYRRKDIIFPVSVEFKSHHFESLFNLRPGDEMYVSSDGEVITRVVSNPLWKRLWRQLTWSF